MVDVPKAVNTQKPDDTNLVEMLMDKYPDVEYMIEKLKKDYLYD